MEHKFAIFDFFGYELPMETNFKLIKQAGFDGVMAWWGFAGRQSEYEKVKKLDVARKEGLEVINMHAEFEGVNNIWLDNLAGEEFFSLMLSSIADCNKYNIPIVVMHTSSGSNSPEISEIGINRIKKIVETAERFDVEVALENLRTVKYLEYIFNIIKSNKLKFCYDSGHENCRTPEVNCLEKFGDKLVALHLHDNNGKFSAAKNPDEHILPFTGTIQWEKVMQNLKRTGYRGQLAFEVYGKEEPPKVFLQKAYTVAKKLAEIYDKIDILCDGKEASRDLRYN